MSCAECIYWDAATFTCHCFPPIADHKWPQTKPTDWCGEFVKEIDG